MRRGALNKLCVRRAVDIFGPFFLSIVLVRRLNTPSYVELSLSSQIER